MRNYRPAFVEGTTNVRTKAFRYHMVTYMHAHVEGPPLADWDYTRALELWYIEKTRRPNVKHSHQLQGGLKVM